MGKTDELAAPGISPAEIKRRLAEYRRQGFEHSAIPHGVYQEPFIECPWLGCVFRISAIDFQIERAADPGFYSRVILAWWQGPGVVGRCPGCGNHVLFSTTEKQSVSDPSAAGMTLLPDDWHQHAYIIS